MLDNDQWYMCCSHNNCILAAKGGTNNETDNHNETGNFMYVADGDGKITMGMKKTYSLENNEKINRVIKFDHRSGKCKIIDEFPIRENRTVVETLISCYEPRMKNDMFLVDTDKGRFRIMCFNGIEYSIIKNEYEDYQGQKKQVWLMQWRVPGHREEIRIEKI